MSKYHSVSPKDVGVHPKLCLTLPLGEKDENYLPYRPAIAELRRVSDSFSPLNKLECLGEFPQISKYILRRFFFFWRCLAMLWLISVLIPILILNVCWDYWEHEPGKLLNHSDNLCLTCIYMFVYSEGIILCKSHSIIFFCDPMKLMNPMYWYEVLEPYINLWNIWKCWGIWVP